MRSGLRRAVGFSELRDGGVKDLSQRVLDGALLHGIKAAAQMFR